MHSMMFHTIYCIQWHRHDLSNYWLVIYVDDLNYVATNYNIVVHFHAIITTDKTFYRFIKSWDCISFSYFIHYFHYWLLFIFLIWNHYPAMNHFYNGFSHKLWFEYFKWFRNCQSYSLCAALGTKLSVNTIFYGIPFAYC